MKKIYSGKTKDIYKKPSGNLLIRFKDDVTGEGGVVDPGSNTVMGKIEGKGRMSLELTRYFYDILSKDGIPTHLVSVDVGGSAMEVREALLPGKKVCSDGGGLEFVCRRLACGSFVKRYGRYVREKLQELDCIVEITLKDDERGDPLINDDSIVALGLLTRKELEIAKDLTRRITKRIEGDLAGKGLRLIDIKMEFGIIDGGISLVDEISADSMRVMDGTGKQLSHEELYLCLVKNGS